MPDLTGMLVVEIPCRTCGGSGRRDDLPPVGFGHVDRRSHSCLACRGQAVEHLAPAAYCELRGEHGPWVVDVHSETFPAGTFWRPTAYEIIAGIDFMVDVHCGICTATPPEKEHSGA